jgi:hypothetical protein
VKKDNSITWLRLLLFVAYITVIVLLPHGGVHLNSAGTGLAAGSYLSLLAVTCIAEGRQNRQKQKRETEARDLARKENELGRLASSWHYCDGTYYRYRADCPVDGDAPSLTPVSSGHHCDGKYYQSEVYCPVHGNAPSLTPVKSSNVPPLAQLAQIAGQYQLPLQTVTTAEFTAHLTALANAVDPQGQPVGKAPEKKPEYVPEGQAELTANLLAAIKSQVRDAVEADGKFRWHWEMNAEWAGEVKKLKGRDGKQLWQPRTRTMPPGYPREYLFKYPVRVSSAYGAPSLEES